MTDHLSPPKPAPAIRVGVTGHRSSRLSADQIARIAAQTSEVLESVAHCMDDATTRYARVYADRAPILYFVSALADGADTLAARCALALGWRLLAPLPFSVKAYAVDFSTEDRNELDALLGAAEAVAELDGERGSPVTEERAYLQAGLVTVDQSDIVIAIWDGEEARGVGGTAMIKEEALSAGKAVIWINAVSDKPPALVAPNAPASPLTPERLAAVVDRIVAPPQRSEIEHAFGGGDTHALNAYETYTEEKRNVFNYGSFFQFWERVFAGRWPFVAKLRNRTPQEEIDAARQSTLAMKIQSSIHDQAVFNDLILPRFAWADHLAVHYGNLYRSSYFFNYLFAAVAVFLALFDLVAGPIGFGSKTVWISVEVTLIILILAVTITGKRGRWHEKWIDYRQLAEELRQYRLYFLTLGRGMSDEAPQGDAGAAASWVDWYFAATRREAGMTSGSFAPDDQRAIAEVILNEEIRPQIVYHERKAKMLHDMEHRLHHLGEYAFGATLLFCLGYLALAFSAGKETAFEKWAYETKNAVKGLVTMLTGFLPALGAAFFGIRVQGEFGSTAERSHATAAQLTAILPIRKQAPLSPRGRFGLKTVPVSVRRLPQDSDVSPMTAVSVLLASRDEAIGVRIADALSREGHTAQLAGDDPSFEADAAIVIWSNAALKLAELHEQARAALERGSLVPVAIGGAPPPDGFEDLPPIDLSGWQGEDGDPRWRFVLDEISIAAQRKRIGEQENWARAQAEILAPADEVAPPAAPYRPRRRQRRFEPGAVVVLGVLLLCAVAGGAMIFASTLTPRPESAATPAPERQAVERAPAPSEESVAQLQSVQPADPDALPDAPPPVAPSSAVDDQTDGSAIRAGAGTAPSLKPESSTPDTAPVELAAADEGPVEPSVAERLRPGSMEDLLSAVPELSDDPDAAGSADPVAADAGAELDGGAEEAPSPAPQPGDGIFADCAQCPDLRALPAGSFRMGSTDRARTQERPVVDVTIAQPFAMGVREVTRAEWGICVADGACPALPRLEGSKDLPASLVSFRDARGYAEWLSEKTGRRYRLPSEAEWEYAARAGVETAFSFGDGISPQNANYDAQYPFKGPRGVAVGAPTVAGSYPSNGFGLFDMHGNLWEWTADCWKADHAGAPADGSPRAGACARRVIKGGAFNSGGWRLRAAHRLGKPETAREHDIGFRVVRELD